MRLQYASLPLTFLIMLCAVSARGAVITETFDIKATRFDYIDLVIDNAKPPIRELDASYTVTFDPIQIHPYSTHDSPQITLATSLLELNNTLLQSGWSQTCLSIQSLIEVRIISSPERRARRSSFDRILRRSTIS